MFALRRNPASVPAPLRGVAADLSEPATLGSLPTGLTRVAYTAAADNSSDAAYKAAYVDGLNNLLLSLSHATTPVRRILFTSSTAVYAQTDGGWVDEASEALPGGFSGMRTLQAEQLLTGCGIPSVIVRAAGIYGPGRTRLIDEVRAGRASYDAARTEYTNRIHVDDLARAMSLLLLHPEPPRLVLAVDDEPAPRRQVLEWLAERLGVPAPVGTDPTAEPARGQPAAGSPAAGSPSIGRPRRSDSNKRISNALLRSLGVELEYPSFREGYAALLKAAR